MNILLLQNSQEVREKVVFFIESTYSARVHEANNVTNAVKFLMEAKPPVDLIVLDYDGSDLNVLWMAVKDIPIVLVQNRGEEPPATKGNVLGVIERAAFMEGLVAVIDELIDKGILHESKSEVAQIRIQTKLLLAVAPLKGDIYIRLGQDKFVKLFRQGDVFDLADLEKYTIKKGVEYLYIRKEQCKEFSEKYKVDLQKLLEKVETLDLEQVASLNESVHETVQELSKHLGFTKEVQELAKTQVQITMKAMGQNPVLSELLAKLKRHQGKYIASHSTVCAYLSCAIATQLKWGSETTFHKLSLASFLHDVTLKNNDLAEINTIDELEKNRARFTPEEMKAFRNHPVDAAEVAKGFSEVPPDVDTIIRQHHERPDGSGFPRGLSHTYMAPLAIVFMVAHDFTQYTIKAGDKLNVNEWVNSVRDKYTSSQFKKALAVIETMGDIKQMAKSINSSRKK